MCFPPDLQFSICSHLEVKLQKCIIDLQGWFWNVFENNALSLFCAIYRNCKLALFTLTLSPEKNSIFSLFSLSDKDLFSVKFHLNFDCLHIQLFRHMNDIASQNWLLWIIATKDINTPMKITATESVPRAKDMTRCFFLSCWKRQWLCKLLQWEKWSNHGSGKIMVIEKNKIKWNLRVGGNILNW